MLKKTIIIAIVIILGLTVVVLIKPYLEGEKNTMTPENQQKNQKIANKDIRQPAVAGQFYPDDPKELGEMVNGFLQRAEKKDFPGKPRVLISPHAGYVFSGQVAAAALKQVEGSGFQRVILIGRSHNYFFSGVAADTHLLWQTPLETSFLTGQAPLGDVSVDQEFIKLLKGALSSPVVSDAKPHEAEHSLEVMLPFLQKVLGKNIRIVPLLFGDDDSEIASRLGKLLSEKIDQNTVVVISSDLSHYPSYDDAQELDQKTIQAILTNDPEKFQQTVRGLENSGKPGVSTLACAEPAIVAGLALSQAMGLEPHLLKYANSGDAMAETRDRVVGYAAIGFYGRDPALLGKKEAGFPLELLEEEQKLALEIARKTLELAFENKKYEPKTQGYSIFQEKRGVFVTLKKNEQLRGCIGSFEPAETLAENIRNMVLSAAFSDPRFLPLQKQELKDCQIEISVLSPMQKITEPDLIEVGKHGVYVKKGLKSGVYLPQVAQEQGWTREEFLDSLCVHKSGIGKNCWKNPSVDLYIFTAQVFNEIGAR